MSTGQPMTAIRDVVDRVTKELRSKGYLPGALRGVVYESEAGELYTVALSSYEMYLIDRELYGDDVAAYNAYVMREVSQ